MRRRSKFKEERANTVWQCFSVEKHCHTRWFQNADSALVPAPRLDVRLNRSLTRNDSGGVAWDRSSKFKEETVSTVWQCFSTEKHGHTLWFHWSKLFLAPGHNMIFYFISITPLMHTLVIKWFPTLSVSFGSSQPTVPRTYRVFSPHHAHVSLPHQMIKAVHESIRKWSVIWDICKCSMLGCGEKYNKNIINFH